MIRSMRLAIARFCLVPLGLLAVWGWPVSNAEGQLPAADGFVPRGTTLQTAPAELTPDAHVAPVLPAPADSPAASLLATALNARGPGEMAGTPLTMADLLAPVHEQTQRFATVRAYWELSLAIAADSFARDEIDRLRVAIAGQGDDDALLAAALAGADARGRETRLQAVDAQHRLVQQRGQSLDESLPLPADMPVTRAYRTYYEEIFVRRNQPHDERLAARRAHETLPLAREVVGARAASVLAATSLADKTASAWRKGAASRDDFLAAWRQLSFERRMFLDAVLKYNLTIAEYAVRASSGDADNVRLAAMLSYSRSASASAAAPREPARTGAPRVAADGAATESFESSRLIPADQAVVPAAAIEPADAEHGPRNRQLRSIVVPRRDRAPNSP